MKYRQFKRTCSEYMPGMTSGVDDADTLYYGFVMQLIAGTGRNCVGLMSCDDVLILSGITSAGSAKIDQKKLRFI